MFFTPFLQRLSHLSGWLLSLIVVDRQPTVDVHLFASIQREGRTQRPRGSLWARAPAGKKGGVWMGVCVYGVPPSETLVISPLMGEIAWECVCECGNFA